MQNKTKINLDLNNPAVSNDIRGVLMPMYKRRQSVYVSSRDILAKPKILTSKVHEGLPREDHVKKYEKMVIGHSQDFLTQKKIDNYIYKIPLQNKIPSNRTVQNSKTLISDFKISFTATKKAPQLSVSVVQKLVDPLAYLNSSKEDVARVNKTIFGKNKSTNNRFVEYIKVNDSTKKRKYSLNLYLRTGIAMVLLVSGITLSWQGFRHNNELVAQVQALQKNNSESVLSDTTQTDNSSQSPPSDPLAPDEKPISKSVVSNYTVPSDQPKRIVIPKLGVDAFIKKQGVNKKGEMSVPGSIHTVGWYDGSAKPGDVGAMLLAGHVSGPTMAGVFKKLDKLNRGDKITIEQGDGKIREYAVVFSEKFSKDSVDMQKALTAITLGRAGVNLITCTGALIPGHPEFSERLVVYAEAT